MSGRRVCEGCGRPQSVCLCSHLPSLQLPFQLTIWQDPLEAKHPLSTAPLLQRMAAGSRLIVAEELSFADLFGDTPSAQVALLYPADDIPPLPLEQARRSVSYVLVLDGTWRKVRRLTLLNPWLLSLQRLSLSPGQPSKYLRKSPRADGLSTLEAVFSLADDWQSGQYAYAGAALLERMAELQSGFV